MIYKEYAIYDLDFSETEIKNITEKIIDLDINAISIPYFYTKLVKSIVGDRPIKVINAIDYPFGILDTKSRNQAINSAIDNGANGVSVVFQNNLLSNKKYDKLRLDIDSNLNICKNSNININFYLEYRIFTHQSLIKACNLLLEFGIEKIYVSTGYLLDDIYDNIIAVNLLKQKTAIQPILSANMWTNDHMNMVYKNNISLIRFNNINALRTYNDFIINKNKK